MNDNLLNMANDAWQMFQYLALELTILFLGISYLVGVMQEFVTPERIQRALSARHGRGYFVAAFLGSVTPFCSCSTIPMLKGLLRARAEFGPLLVFLFSSPLLNPVVIGLLIATFGLDVALFYFTVAMTVSITAGFVLQHLGFDRYIKPDVFDVTPSATCSKKPSSTRCSETDNAEPTRSGCGNQAATVEPPAVACCAPDGTASVAPIMPAIDWMAIWHTTWRDFKQVLPYLLLGITIGSFIYGFVPTELIATYSGADKWYAIPVAAVIGIPLYIRASTVIPLAAGLVQKGMALGSVMALIIGSAGASLTEVILLKSIFRNQMIAAFLFVVLSMAIGAGILYQAMWG